SDQFHGRVSQIRMNATTVQNVVTYDTIVEFDNPEMKLFPGMTAYVTIPVATAHDVLKVPNAALRYKPDLKPDEIRNLYAKAGITTPARSQGGARAQGGQNQTDSGAPRTPGQAESGQPAAQASQQSAPGEHPRGQGQRQFGGEGQ